MMSTAARRTLVKALCAASIAGLAPVMATQAFADTDGLSVTDGWMRIIVASRPAAGYFTIENDGSVERKLVGAFSPACGMMMLHRSKSENGVDKMMPVKVVAVPAHGSVRFAPGGYHIMCMQPEAIMQAGNTAPVTLTFADGSKLTADFEVRGATSK